jgi:hypothetical protein
VRAATADKAEHHEEQAGPQHSPTTGLEDLQKYTFSSKKMWAAYKLMPYLSNRCLKFFLLKETI